MARNRQELLEYYLEESIFHYFDNFMDPNQENSILAEELIVLYYSIVNKPKFDFLCQNFIKKYIDNESELEGVHQPEERDGLREVYDKTIRQFVPDKDLDIYFLKQIHEWLYSKCPYPEAGGRYRTGDVYLPGTGVNLTPYNQVANQMSDLYEDSIKLFERGKSLGLHKDTDILLDYINDCIELKCKIIKIHPFQDGNGRSARVFLNLLFKMANIPPVYIEAKEQLAYHKALNKAHTENDYQDIKVFYYHKILDSIFQLDILPRMENYHNRQVKQK